MSEAIPKKRRFHWSLVWSALLLAGLAAGGIGIYAEAARWNDRIAPGVFIGLVPVGKKTPAQARQLIEQRIDDLLRTGMPLVAGETRTSLIPIISSPNDPDLTYPMVEWDVPNMIARAYAIGHTGPWWQRWGAFLPTRIQTVKISAEPTLATERVAIAIKENFGALEYPATDARLVVRDAEVTIAPETIGRAIDLPDAQSRLREAFSRLTAEPITLRMTTAYPEVTTADLEPLVPEVAALIARGMLTLTDGNHSWSVPPEAYGTWLEPQRVDGALRLSFVSEKTRTYLADIAITIDHPAQNATFAITNGRVASFTPSHDGRVLTVDDSLATMDNAVLANGSMSVPLVVAVTAPTVTTDSVNDLGIIEQIGVGRSNFAGSPKNRRKNIANGANALNGLLIPPDTEFSLVDALGDIDAANGYFPELVIKGNRTIPEYGGGLCQIGTTMFRAAMATGLPVTERQNHSYSVRYYFENGKPGTDATIYGPHPDLRFRNDTGRTMLIQTFVDGDDLRFELWGKKDGRVASRTEPRVWNYVQPPEPKIVLTDDLAPGVKKCTESAHTGMTAEFAYTVAMPDGEERKQTFRSLYRPWQAVCVVGRSLEERAAMRDAAPAQPDSPVQ